MKLRKSVLLAVDSSHNLAVNLHLAERPKHSLSTVRSAREIYHEHLHALIHPHTNTYALILCFVAIKASPKASTVTVNKQAVNVCQYWGINSISQITVDISGYVIQ